MATSGTVSYTITAADCMRLALQKITVIGQGDTISPYDFGVAKDELNLMLKAWQNQAEHLWVTQKVNLFLQKGQSSYVISTTSTDHITGDLPVYTTVLTAVAVGATIINVTSTTGMTNGDYIGIQTDSDTFFWSRILYVLSATQIQITVATTDTSAIGLYVFTYTNPITSAFNPVMAVRRLISSQLDTPLLMQSYADYVRMPNKFALGTPNMWSYDRQRDSLIINIWMTPSNVAYYLPFVIERKIQDINIGADNFDLPQEWGEAIYLNLALRLAPGYGKAQGENFAELKEQAKNSLLLALEMDNELGSIYIIPARSGTRGN